MRVPMMLAALVTAATAPATGQIAPPSRQPAAPCPRAPPRLPPELAGWRNAAPITSARNVQELGLATLTIGQSARAALAPMRRLAFPATPGHAAAGDTHGGLFAFTVTQAGTYRVALDAPAWIDVVASGRVAASSAHRHGPACSGVAKLVDFPLQPGRHVLQLAGGAAPQLTLMVARLP